MSYSLCPYAPPPRLTTTSPVSKLVHFPVIKLSPPLVTYSASLKTIFFFIISCGWLRDIIFYFFSYFLPVYYLRS